MEEAAISCMMFRLFMRFRAEGKKEKEKYCDTGMVPHLPTKPCKLPNFKIEKSNFLQVTRVFENKVKKKKMLINNPSSHVTHLMPKKKNMKNRFLLSFARREMEEKWSPNSLKSIA